MADVADGAGVSTTTVSFVLSGKENVSISQETRDRVVRVATELDYRRNAAASSLASRRTRLLGVVTDVVTGPFAGDAILGVQDMAWANDLQFLIASVEHMPHIEEAPFRMLADRQVEALVVIMAANKPLSLPAEALRVPCVVVNSFDAAGAVPCITPDEEKGGFDATQRLIDAGHRRIAMINLEPDRAAAVGRRLGHERALQLAGIPRDGALILEGPADAHQGYDSARRLLALDEPPSAIFCATDRIAMGAYDAIKEEGLRIPQDVSVIGFDDQQILTEYLRPPLTTMRLPFREMAGRAVEMLAHAAGDEAATLASERMTCRLIERESVSAPADRGRDARGRPGQTADGPTPADIRRLHPPEPAGTIHRSETTTTKEVDQ